MMILPLILLVLLPKIMSDPETKKEMENLQLPKLGGDMPDMSEMISKFLGGGSSAPKPSTSNAGSGGGGKAKKRNWILSCKLFCMRVGVVWKWIKSDHVEV